MYVVQQQQEKEIGTILAWNKQNGGGGADKEEHYLGNRGGRERRIHIHKEKEKEREGRNVVG